ncbi:MAG: hypothetical protein ACLS3C_11040 [Oscillospiraceae bacterium]
MRRVEAHRGERILQAGRGATRQRPWDFGYFADLPVRGITVQDQAARRAERLSARGLLPGIERMWTQSMSSATSTQETMLEPEAPEDEEEENSATAFPPPLCAISLATGDSQND